jgi:hypothetical protein
MSKSIETNEHLSRHIDLLCEMLTSLLIMGIQMGEMSKLGWLIRSIEQAIWAASLYFHREELPIEVLFFWCPHLKQKLNKV